MYNPTFGIGVSLILYGVLLFAEWMRPRIVSVHFSPHLLLLVVALCFVWWVYDDRDDIRQSHHFIMRICLSCILAIVCWQAGRLFGDFRLFLALFAAYIPWVQYEHVKKKKQKTVDQHKQHVLR